VPGTVADSREGRATQRATPAAFLTGQTISLIGSQVTTYLLPVIVVVVLHGGARAVSLLVAAGTVPQMVSGVIAGPITDRRSKRWVLMVADLTSMAILLLTVALWTFGQLSAPVLIVVAVVLGNFGSISDSALFAFVPTLVSGQELLRLNGRLEVCENLAVLVGPVAGGALIGAGLGRIGLLIDAASFAVAYLTLRHVRRDEVDAQPGAQPGTQPDGGPDGGYVQRVAAGFRLLRSLRGVRVITGLSSAWNLFVGAAEATVVVYALHFLWMSTVEFGVCIAGGAMGGILAGSLVGRLRWAPSLMMAGGLVTGALGQLITAIGPARSVLGVLAVGGGELVGAAGMTVFLFTNSSIRQVLIPRAARARVHASMRLVTRASVIPGSLCGGLLFVLLGARPLMLSIAGAEMLVAASAWLLLPRLIPADILKRAGQA
jgi:MFS family permease